MPGHEEGDWEREHSDLKEPVESERLVFCVPLFDNKSPSNKAARRWLQAIRVTTTEGDAPQRATRWLKTRCRTNLRAAEFPPELLFLFS